MHRMQQRRRIAAGEIWLGLKGPSLCGYLCLCLCLCPSLCLSLSECVCVCTCFTGIQNPSERLSSSIINFNANSSCTSSAMDQKATETAEQQSQPGAVQGQLQGGRASRTEPSWKSNSIKAIMRQRERETKCSKQCNSGVPPDGLRITERGERWRWRRRLCFMCNGA